MGLLDRLRGRAAAPAPRVRLLTRPGCHLCEEARVVVERECRRAGAVLTEVSILDDPALEAAYWDRIPVVEVDGQVVEALRVDPDRLRRRLAGDRRLTW
ncbi:glutaredoxin family protein [Aquipuribacter sp. SD81]|uniref:glutaredoxin family protein n=1 Tax=Aquipuribacter sp. SD81 TaxID=3127703 RepID=UPI003016CB1A